MSKRILLVEDEEDNLTLLVHILKFLLGQEQLYIAKDGQEAMRMAYQQRPDLILMDLSLPKLDGWEVARSLRADAAFRTTPIIALTAHAMAGDKERALEVGCTDYFPKPIDIDRFMPFIDPYLKQVAPTQTATPAPAQPQQTTPAPVEPQEAAPTPAQPLETAQTAPQPEPSAVSAPSGTSAPSTTSTSDRGAAPPPLAPPSVAPPSVSVEPGSDNKSVISTGNSSGEKESHD